MLIIYAKYAAQFFTFRIKPKELPKIINILFSKTGLLKSLPKHKKNFSSFFPDLPKFTFKRNFGEKKTLSFSPNNFSEEFI